jgi:hypothetical protein
MAIRHDTHRVIKFKSSRCLAALSPEVRKRYAVFEKAGLPPMEFALGLDLNGRAVRNLQHPAPTCFTQIAKSQRDFVCHMSDLL